MALARAQFFRNFLELFSFCPWLSIRVTYQRTHHVSLTTGDSPRRLLAFPSESLLFDAKLFKTTYQLSKFYQ